MTLEEEMAVRKDERERVAENMEHRAAALEHLQKLTGTPDSMIHLYTEAADIVRNMPEILKPWSLE